MKFFDILDLNKDLEQSLEVIEARQIELSGAKQIAIKMNSNKFLNEEELFELFSKMNDSKIPVALENVFINSERKELTDYEVYSYIVKLKDIFMPAVNMSHLQVQTKDGQQKFIITNRATYSTVKQKAETIARILINTLVANLSIVFEESAQDHSKLLERIERQTEKEEVVAESKP